MRVYVIRHGESESNRNGLWTGWLDAPLTDKGRDDAAAVSAVISGVSFEKIYASDLKRAKSTASIAIPGCKYELRRELREINVGDIAGNPLDSINSEEKKEIQKSGYSVFGGESKADFEKRIRSFIEELESDCVENVAVFSHAGWLRGLLDIVVGCILPREKILCKNCTVGVFEYDGVLWKLHSWINID